MTGFGLAQPWLAFAAGVSTVAAPCVLPLLPVVLGATTAGGPGARPVFIAAGFALSFTVLALVFGSVQHLLGLYALGAALPMLGIAYGGKWVLAKVRTLIGHTHKVQRATGLIVAAGGLLTFLQYDTSITLWLSDFCPSISAVVLVDFWTHACINRPTRTSTGLPCTSSMAKVEFGTATSAKASTTALKKPSARCLPDRIACLICSGLSLS